MSLVYTTGTAIFVSIQHKKPNFMKKKLLILLSLVIASGSISAQENKPQVKVGGTLYFATFYDSYKSVDNRAGVSYSYPMAPNYDPDGKDLNKTGQFGMSVYQTRFNIGVTNLKLLNADADIYIETDFMGASKEFMQMVRLRHAYANLKWDRDELLLGQTNNVESPEEVTSGVLTAGAASPIAILSRPVMIRYGRTLSDRFKVYGAMSYHVAQAVSGGVETSRNSGLPSFEARIQYASDKLFFGIGGAYMMLRPRISTQEGYKAGSTISSGSATAFFRYLSNGYSFKAQAIYGSNLSHLGMIGGYGKRLDESIDGDYGYTNLTTGTIWGDFETKDHKNFRLGLFGGYMKNFGSEKAIDPSKVFARDATLSYTGRISPRLTYGYKSLLVGIEYSLFWSKWGKEFNDHYKASETYETTYNNRITLLFRYKF